MTPSSFRKFVEFAALCALSAAILWYFGRKLDWVEVRHAVSHSNMYLLGIAVLIVCLVYLVQACRWGVLLTPFGPTSLKHVFAATTMGLSAIFLLGRLGELVRPVVLPLRDPRVRASASFVTIMVEKIYDLTAIVLLFAANLLWLRPPNRMAGEWSRVRIAGITLLIGAMAGIAALNWFRRESTKTIAWLNRHLNSWRFIPGRLTMLMIRTLEQLAKALRVLVDARKLAVAIGWTILVWAGIAAANLLVIRAFRVPFGITETIFVLGWSIVGSLVPTPGGAAGFYHAAMAAGLIFLGVARETAAAISIVMHLVGFGPAVVFGFFYFVRGDINLSRLRSLTSPRAVEHAVEDEEIVPVL
ncbi:MAG TPA: lysylphosphatidylglycerol synthase transmembrane domain-containing protein [Pyrinomonadaceae bacterium]|nr:lysylphosphatidylglycerol synthase transmembrane domain-containing protein [Pyrinomonadaceae bacterium]